VLAAGQSHGQASWFEAVTSGFGWLVLDPTDQQEGSTGAPSSKPDPQAVVRRRRFVPDSVGGVDAREPQQAHP